MSINTFLNFINVVIELKIDHPKDYADFLSWIVCLKGYGAGGRTRTDMSSEARQILSLVRIPISPLRLLAGLTFYGLSRNCATTLYLQAISGPFWFPIVYFSVFIFHLGTTTQTDFASKAGSSSLQACFGSCWLV